MSRRLRIALGGVLVSVALVGTFVGASEIQFHITQDGPGHLNWLYHLLIVVFLMLNPVFALIAFASLALPTAFTVTPAGQRVIGAVYFAAFFGGWWLVATFIDRVLVPKRGAA